jgi:hypothetical protein
MKKTLRRALLLSVVLMLVTPVAANAASSSGKQQHCIVQAQAVGTTGQSTVRCYATFAAAIKAATSGRVNLRNATTSREVSSTELSEGPYSTLSTYILSVDYHDANYSGSTLVIYQSAPCGYYQSSSMPSGWNDVVSSVIDHSGCATTLYQNSNFGGAVYRIGVNGSAASLGSFNDQTSSQKWCPFYPCT